MAFQRLWILKFSGGEWPHTPRISRIFGARPPHFEKASADPVIHLYLHAQVHWAIPFILHPYRGTLEFFNSILLVI